MLSDRVGEKREPAASDATNRQPIRRHHVLGGLALVLATGFIGALLGFLLPSLLGTDTAVLAGITFVLSPVAVALYGAIAVATFLLTLLFVLRVVSQFDDA